MPLVQVLIDMEEHGVKLDLALLESLSTELEKELIFLQKSIYTQAGGEFNINSPSNWESCYSKNWRSIRPWPCANPSVPRQVSMPASEQVLERYRNIYFPEPFWNVT